MTSVAILSILLSTAVPSVGYIIERYEAYIAVSTLANTFRRSRKLALQLQIEMTACPIKNNQCHNEWGSPITVFTDINNNQTIDPDESIFFSTEMKNTSGYWQKKRLNSPYMKFNPLGHAFSTATTFLYCTYSSKPMLAKQLVVNFQGRIRVNHYLSGNGNPFASLAPLTCN